jgi:hypothetical protein
MEDTFKNKQAIRQHGAEILAQKAFTPEQLWEEYATLLHHYQTLLDLSH